MSKHQVMNEAHARIAAYVATRNVLEQDGGDHADTILLINDAINKWHHVAVSWMPAEKFDRRTTN